MEEDFKSQVPRHNPYLSWGSGLLIASIALLITYWVIEEHRWVNSRLQHISSYAVYLLSLLTLLTSILWFAITAIRRNLLTGSLILLLTALPIAIVVVSLIEAPCTNSSVTQQLEAFLYGWGMGTDLNEEWYPDPEHMCKL